MAMLPMNAMHQAFLRVYGQKALLDARIAEFEGYGLIGNMTAAETCREEARTILDALFDSRAELSEMMRRGGF